MRNNEYCEIIPCIFNITGKKKLCWVITKRCNLSCKHCCTNSRPNLSRAEYNVNKNLEEIFENEFNKIIISGGEPIISRNFLYILKEIKNNNGKIKITVSSNGIGLTEEIIKSVRNLIDGIILSIDGRKYWHNELRGDKGAFEKVKIASSIIKNEKFKKTYNYTILGADINKLAKDASAIYDMAAFFNFDEVTFTFPMLTGRMKKMKNEWREVWESKKMIINILSRICSSKKIRTKIYIPECNNRNLCPSKKEIFGKIEGGEVGDCVYVQYK